MTQEQQQELFVLEVTNFGNTDNEWKPKYLMRFESEAEMDAHIQKEKGNKFGQMHTYNKFKATKI